MPLQPVLNLLLRWRSKQAYQSPVCKGNSNVPLLVRTPGVPPVDSTFRRLDKIKETAQHRCWPHG